MGRRVGVLKWLPLAAALLAGCVDFDTLDRCHGGACGGAAPTPSTVETPSVDAGGAERAGPGIKPDATNTGVPAGVSLTVVDHDVTVTEDGAHVDAQDIRGILTIRANRVRITRSIVRARPVEGRGAAINVVSGVDVVLEDTEVAIANPADGLDGVWARAVTARRLNVHGASDGMKIGSGSAIEHSYVHDLVTFTPAFNKAVAISGGVGIRLTGNRLEVGRDQGAALQVTQTTPVEGMLVDANWLDGGGCTMNLSHRGQSALTLTVRGNRFGGDSLHFHCAILKSTQTTLLGDGNVWDDTGEPVPVQSHD